MERPKSIVNFERCYLGAVLVGLINVALNWSAMQETTQVRQANAMMGNASTTIMAASMIFGLVISGLLWFFTARKGSVVAKWIVVVFFAFSILSLLSGFAMHTYVSTLQMVLTLVGFALNAAAVWMLFQPDTRPWFGEGNA